MDIESINKQIQTEKDSYNRAKNRLQQKLLTLKQRHQRNMEYLQTQKLNAKQKNNDFKYLNQQIKQYTDNI